MNWHWRRRPDFHQGQGLRQEVLRPPTLEIAVHQGKRPCSLRATTDFGKVAVIHTQPRQPPTRAHARHGPGQAS